MKIKFPKVSSGNKRLFDEALSLFKKGSYSECYNIISGMADDGVGRACYARALLDVNPDVPEAKGDEAFLQGMKKAATLKYPLAYGALAIYYYECDNYDELVKLCVANKKLAEPRLQTMLASIYDGFYSEYTSYENLKLARAAYDAAGMLFELSIRGKKELYPEWQENDVYYGAKLSLYETYALYNRLLMISYKFIGDFANRKAYRTAYERAVKFSRDDLFLYGVNRINAQTLMDDVMGLSELKAVNASMKGLEDAYQRLSEDLKEANSETYDAVWEKYEEYYEAETRRLASVNLHATSDMEALFPGMGLSDVVSGLSKGVARWADLPSKTTEYSYEIDGVTYRKGDDLGYLYDENGNRTGYRIDDVDRLRTEDGEELGYFSTDGIFMPKK